ncbi:hypothetical protein HPG69_009338 [Diceros bicornis minor]|uniref:CLIC N-terminal domain-containing protein n=1 Tax=Diceros bicornis minor TaxID=77932 RepID=A0A7J7EEQ5_DICBM|nr:hypothetical protein HPG69_009338 [Diceros bicornis minor]
MALLIPLNGVKKTAKECITDLFVKADSDDESIENCPLSQRIFMILWLQAVVFSVTTVGLKRKLADLLNMCSKLSPKYPESNTVRIDIFPKFSVYITSRPEADEASERHLLKTLQKLDEYLNSPKPGETNVDKNNLNFDIPKRVTGIWRYLTSDYIRDEFTNTCPNDKEVEIAYSDAAKRLTK